MSGFEDRLKQMHDLYATRTVWDVPEDYFSWGRDKRHLLDDSEALAEEPVHNEKKPMIKRLARTVRYALRKLRGSNIQDRDPQGFEDLLRIRYASFASTYDLMSNEASKTLFAELIYMKIVGPENMRLSTFTNEFVETYEKASDSILNATGERLIYGWKLKKVKFDSPSIELFTAPTVVNNHLAGRLYEYNHGDVHISVCPGDIVIDGGVGWGDTTTYLAAKASDGKAGKVFAFDILEDGLTVLKEQVALNPGVNVEPVFLALTDVNDELLSVANPGPGAYLSDQKGATTVKTCRIDTFVSNRNLETVNFIKMDIEGAEIPALTGASDTIRNFKPKLAISAYHKWDDLLAIPTLIHSIRNDYEFYLDCTTGFGGEIVLYCR
ncbi:FkbM family methyltransferase [uncultured Roseobacter sp.]|uniref:FkbM family methyltransferase n=1 Tax=uncultured Roseobacter sp. TaxID=114847 RepID=UPI002614C7A9|nr:FkbM family methyltransferase [uncultured Roseobacter sp.]